MTAPLTPEEWEEVALITGWLATITADPIYLSAHQMSLLLRALAERTAERDEHAHVPMFYGEVMICEEHFWLLWPHGECAGPGMPLSGAKGYQDQLDALRLRVERIERETWEAAAKEIPTNWCDPLLTGPDAVDLKRTPNPIIERLLLRLVERLRARAARPPDAGREEATT